MVRAVSRRDVDGVTRLKAPVLPANSCVIERLGPLAFRRDLARLIRAHYVTEQSASMDTVVYVITDHGRRALAN